MSGKKETNLVATTSGGSRGLENMRSIWCAAPFISATFTLDDMSNARSKKKKKRER